MSLLPPTVVPTRLSRLLNARTSPSKHLPPLRKSLSYSLLPTPVTWANLWQSLLANPLALWFLILSPINVMVTVRGNRSAKVTTLLRQLVETCATSLNFTLTTKVLTKVRPLLPPEGSGAKTQPVPPQMESSVKLTFPPLCFVTGRLKIKLTELGKIDRTLLTKNPPIFAVLARTEFGPKHRPRAMTKLRIRWGQSEKTIKLDRGRTLPLLRQFLPTSCRVPVPLSAVRLTLILQRPWQLVLRRVTVKDLLTMFRLMTATPSLPPRAATGRLPSLHLKAVCNNPSGDSP